MKPRLLSLIIANLFIASPLVHGAGLDWNGSSVSLGVQHVRESARDPSKLNEYRDLDGTSALGGFEARGRGDRYYLDAYGENLLRDDMYLNLSGGQYGVFKYRIYDDEMRHNFGSGPGARSPYSGIGGPVLTATLPNPNQATWNGFDHSYKRRDMGGLFEISANSPWYFRAEANEVKRSGINVFAGANGTSPGNGFMDLPSPIDYTTRNYSGEVGYSSKRGHFAVNLMQSKFENGNDQLRWSNGFFGGLDTTILPPDNSLTRISVNGNLRKLPGDSVLAGRLTYSKVTDDVLMPATMLSTGGANPATNPNSPAFSGNMQKTTLSLSYASHPVMQLDTKLYYNYLKEENKSTQMTFTPAVGSGLLTGSTTPGVNCANVAGSNVCEPERFHYKKQNVGVEAGYRLNRENKLSGGYDYYHVTRERVDFHGNTDNKVFVEWKNSSLDYLTGRIKYQYMQRRSDWSVDPNVVAANTIEPYVRRFDLANVNQNLVKVVLDATPAPMVDLGFEAIYKNNDYKDTILGRTGDERQEYYASVSIGDPKKARVLLFADVEFMEYNSFHRVGTGDPNPSALPTATTYNWTAKNKDKAWQIGIGGDWVPMERLTLKGSLIYAETNGSADFAAQPGGATTVLLPITNFDNTKRTSFNLKGIYNADKHWELTGGYAYERYQYSDIGYDGTRYVTAANSSAGSVTGQFSFQPYNANIFYAIAKYKF